MLQETLNIICYVYAVNVFIAFIFAVSPRMWLEHPVISKLFTLRILLHFMYQQNALTVRVLLVITLFRHVSA